MRLYELLLQPDMCWLLEPASMTMQRLMHGQAKMQCTGSNRPVAPQIGQRLCLQGHRGPDVCVEPADTGALNGSDAHPSAYAH